MDNRNNNNNNINNNNNTSNNNNTISNLKEKVFQYMIHALCSIVAIVLTIYCVYQYILDEDHSRIEFQKFNSEKDHLYPTITLCFIDPLLENKLSTYGEGINGSSYLDFLSGNVWDDRMANIDYDDISLNIEQSLLGK